MYGLVAPRLIYLFVDLLDDCRHGSQLGMKMHLVMYISDTHRKWVYFILERLQITSYEYYGILQAPGEVSAGT